MALVKVLNLANLNLIENSIHLLGFISLTYNHLNINEIDE